jgi:hypothetical protein
MMRRVHPMDSFVVQYPDKTRNFRHSRLHVPDMKNKAKSKGFKPSNTSKHYNKSGNHKK